ncbi:hypothetical protein AAAC51_18750 [Priestia megaterium]
MSSVKEAVYIHWRTKIGIFKPEEITKFSYMHSRGFLLAQVVVWKSP